MVAMEYWKLESRWTSGKAELTMKSKAGGKES